MELHLHIFLLIFLYILLHILGNANYCTVVFGECNIVICSNVQDPAITLHKHFMVNYRKTSYTISGPEILKLLQSNRYCLWAPTYQRKLEIMLTYSDRLYLQKQTFSSFFLNMVKHHLIIIQRCMHVLWVFLVPFNKHNIKLVFSSTTFTLCHAELCLLHS